MRDITQFHHWGFAEWVNEACREQDNQTLNIKVNYDDVEEYYYIDIYNADDLDEFNALESFYYMDLPEIQHDVAEALNQFPIHINLIRHDNK
jgi:hypothetical protein